MIGLNLVKLSFLHFHCAFKVGGAILLVRGILFALHHPHPNNPLFLILPAG
jgi:hypothetical protein